MIQIRKNTFETNSSSTHSICICTEEQHEKWSNGELYLNESNSWNDEDKLLGGKRWVTKDEAINFLKHYNYICDEECDDLDDELREHKIYSYDTWGEDYEHDSTSFETPSGDKMIAECYYGYSY